MIRMKLKACPWCGWRSVTLMTLNGGKHTDYYIHCNHCGLESKKSRFKWLTRYFWNHLNNPVAPTKRERKKRYHIYGQEY